MLPLESKKGKQIALERMRQEYETKREKMRQGTWKLKLNFQQQKLDLVKECALAGDV